MSRKLLIIFIILSVIISVTACGKSANETILPSDDVSDTSEDISSADTSDIIASEPESEIHAPEESQIQSQSMDTAATNRTSSNNSNPTNSPIVSSQPPSSATPQTPVTSTPPTNTITPSTPPAPAYEIMGQDYVNGVLKGMNDRRAALGFPLAKLDTPLSDECLVQAKIMADAGRAFHSEMPTGCEGTARVPNNHPADLLGDVMCTHVPDFLFESNIKVGVAVVKKGNYLYTVVQGAP